MKNIFILIVLITYFGNFVYGESTFNLNGIKVINMGDVPNARAKLLVDIANQSTCDDNPLDNNRCIGIIKSGDRVVVGDNYIAFMDFSRQNIYGGGGGGLLRGLWLLNQDSSGNKNFSNIINGHNKTINLLYPTQVNTIDAGDGIEILAVTEDGKDPIDTYRASSSKTKIIRDGIYNSTTGWEHIYFKFSGTLTQGKGVSESPYNINIGNNNTKLTYEIEYWFFNNNYPFYSNKNRSHQIQIHATVKAENGDTKPLKSLVFSIGLSQIGGSNTNIKMSKFTPQSHDMAFGNYPNASHVQTLRYFRDGEYDFSTEFNQIITESEFLISPPSLFLGTRLVRFNEYFKVQYDAPNLQYVIDKSKVVTSDTKIINKIFTFNQILYDIPNNVVAYDIKVGANRQADGKLGILHQGKSISASYYLHLNSN